MPPTIARQVSGDGVVLRNAIAAMEELYPPVLAEPWDAPGLVCGDPEQTVRRILVAVDPTEHVVDEAIAHGADLLICHHPRLLRPVHGVAATTAAGRVVSSLISAGCALFTAHTNADAANPGVSDALAQALGVTDTRPLEHRGVGEPTCVFVTYVPADHLDAVVDAAAAAGAGQVGDYRRCAFTSPGDGTYEAPADGNPYLGRPGERSVEAEIRVEMTMPARAAAAVVAAVTAAHPYEEPAYSVLDLAAHPHDTGIGRVGTLSEPTTLAAFAEVVAAALPATAAGVRVAGDLDRSIQRVAVCGGAGDSLLADTRAAGADVYVTADLRHHPVLDHLADGGCAVIDVSHWASEWLWCPQVAHLLPGALARQVGDVASSVDIAVSELCTDSWTEHVRSGS